MEIPDEPSLITPQWLTEALARSRAFGEARVSAVRVRPLEPGRGFIGQTARLELEYERPEPPEGPPSRGEAGDANEAPRILFVKQSSSDPVLREILRDARISQAEPCFYSELAERFPVRIPQCYLSLYESSSGRSILLLEDVSPAKLGDDLEGLTDRQARLAVTQMARLHARFWESPDLADLDWLMTPADSVIGSFSYDEMVGFFENRCADFLTPALAAAARGFGFWIASFLSSYSQPPRTLVHGDFRPDNFAFVGPEDDQQLVLLDWGSLRYGRPTFDLSYFLVTSLEVEQRRRCENDLLQLYHETLVASGVGGYSLRDLTLDFRRGLGVALGYLVVTGSALTYEHERAELLVRGLSQRLDAALADHRFSENLKNLL